MRIKVNTKETSLTYKLAKQHFQQDIKITNKKGAQVCTLSTFMNLRRKGNYYAPTVFTCADKRDILRDAVFLCMTPFDTPRINSG